MRMFVVMVMLAMAVRMHVPMFVCVAMLRIVIVFMRVVRALAAAADAAHYSTSSSLIRIWSPPTICS